MLMGGRFGGDDDGLEGLVVVVGWMCLVLEVGVL